MAHDFPRDHPAELGVLGEYIVDSTKCFGLFIQLGSCNAFVDIKEDKLLEQRKAKALELHENQQLLSEKLIAFLASNPEFSSRRIAYICLHSKNLEQGEVFWDPNGYTLLKGFEFQPD